MDLFQSLLDNYNKLIIYFSKPGCSYCFMFEPVWNNLNSVASNSIIKSNEPGHLGFLNDVYVKNIVPISFIDEINEYWKEWAKDKNDLTHLIPKIFGKNEIQKVQNQTYDRGIFNNDHPNEYCRRGFPTILFINGNNYAFIPQEHVDRSIKNIFEISSYIFNDHDFKNIDIDKRNPIDKNNSRYLFIYANSSPCNKKILLNSNNNGQMETILEGICEMSLKIDSLPQEKRNNIVTVSIGELGRSDIPVPSLYDRQFNIFYMYDDALKILNDFILS